MVRTGVANLPNGRAEAKEAMHDVTEEIVTGMEARISYLAIIGTLGPMIGLVGTIWGMIMSFQVIATAAGAQPKPAEIAEGISTALFITLEGVSLAVPAIFFHALFRNRIAQIDHGDDQGGRPDDQLAGGRRQAGQDRLIATRRDRLDARGVRAMSASMSSEVRAEPNLTPLLDVVFQLITFFMLVINFSNDNYDQRVRLPVAGSARPIDDGERIAADQLVLNIDQQGHLLFSGEVQLPHKAIETIKRQAELVRLNARAAGMKLDAQGPAHHHHPPRRPRHAVLLALRPDHRVPDQWLPKFALKAMSGPDPARPGCEWLRGWRLLHSKRKREEVEIPITPMLDMAFQLLTFFVLTFKPAPTEVQFVMNLLPAQPATRMDAAARPESAASDELPAGLRTLPTILRAGAGGTLGRVTLGERDIQGMDALQQELELILKDPTLPFDQALIKVDPDLKYSELMQVIDVFSRLKVTKISFAELTPQEKNGP